MKTKLTLESLDDRALPSGNVVVAADGSGIVQVLGDNKSNEIEVRFQGFDQLTITGLNGTMINGSAAPWTQPSDFVPYGMSIQMGDGHDIVRIVEDGYLWHYMEYLDIDTGNGRDAVSISSTVPASGAFYFTNIYVYTGADNDRVSINNLDAEYLHVSTSGGSDTVEFSGHVNIGVYGGISLGSGNDILIGGVNSESSLTGRMSIDGGLNRDTVVNSDFFYGSYHDFEIERSS